MCGLKAMYDSSEPLNPCCMVRMELDGWWRAMRSSISIQA